jgi:hypothetical protein
MVPKLDCDPGPSAGDLIPPNTNPAVKSILVL